MSIVPLLYAIGPGSFRNGGEAPAMRWLQAILVVGLLTCAGLLWSGAQETERAARAMDFATGLDAANVRPRFDEWRRGDPDPRLAPLEGLIVSVEAVPDTATEALADLRQSVLAQFASSARLDDLRRRQQLAAACTLACSLLLAVTAAAQGRPRSAVSPPAPEQSVVTRKILRSVQNLVVIVSAQGIIQDVNQTTCSALGYLREELVGRKLDVLLDSPPHVDGPSGSYRNHETTYRTKSGAVLPVMLSCSVVDSEGGQVRQLVLSAYDLSERQELEGRLEVLLERLITVQEEERRSVARDLHDGLLQCVIAADLHLRAGGEKNLAHCAERLREAVGEGRRMIQNLRPAVLEQFGLERSLVQLLDDVQERLDWKTSLRYEVSVPVPPALETAAYRIVQEALNNAQKHSESTEVEVTARWEAAVLTVTVRDFGRGFSGGPRQGVGLESMRERAELLGGTFAIEVADPGIRVRATLPARLSSQSSRP